MPLIVADELEADWTRVKIAQATGDEVKYGNQDTDGSRSTRHFFMPMRQVGAAARMMLEAAAAKRWGVPVSDVEAKNHEVIQKSTGQEARLRRPRRRRQHDGRPVECQRREVGRCDAGQPASQGPFAVPLHRQGRDQYRRRLQHHDRSRHLWPGRPLAGAEICRRRAAAGHGGQGRLLRRHGGEKGPRRRPDRRDSCAVLPDEIPAVRGNRNYRRQHLGCDPGPQGAEDHVGRRPARDL